jgi:tetratricopeptide (TPR) repeat protein
MRIESRARRYRLTRLTDWLRDALAEAPALPSQLLAVAVLLVMVASEAGYGDTNWPPAALLLLGLLVVTGIAVPIPRRPGALQLAGLALFAAYAAWSFLSITWAGVAADAWEAAARTSGYLVVIALFLLWPPGARGARLLLAVFSLGVAVIGLVELLRADASATPGGFFIDVRFAEPAGYINANVAMWTLGLFGCVATAAVPRAHPALRGAALAAATLLGGLALLGQSRGWVFALPAALAVLLLISPDRLRIALGSILVAAALLPIRQTLLDVHDRYSPARFDGLLSDATAAIVLVTVVVGLVAALWAFAERRALPDEGVRRRLALGTGVVLVALALGAAGIALAAADDPAGKLSDTWTEFKQGYSDEPPSESESRFASAGSNRYDFWKVAWRGFEDEPIRGLGAENFQRLYLKEGESTEKPRYPHSLELEVLSGLGIVGALLLGGAFLALLGAAARALFAARELRGAAAAALGVFVYWLLHASVDWFWAFFALTGSGLAALALAASLTPAPAAATARAPREDRRGGRTVALVASCVAAALLALAIAAPWLSAREVDHASDIWPEDPDAAFSALDRAETFNPLSSLPDATAGTIALRLDRTDEAERHFRDVLRDDPENAYAALELGLIASAEGRRREAVRMLELSLAQNPRDPLVMGVLEDVSAGRRVSPSRVNARIARSALSVANRAAGSGD